MKTLITAFLFCSKNLENLLPGDMKRSKFLGQKASLEQEVLKTLITKHHASDNGEQRIDDITYKPPVTIRGE